MTADIKLAAGITRNPAVNAGVASTTRGRIPVHKIVLRFFVGESIQEISEAFSVDREDIEDAIRYRMRWNDEEED